MNATIESLPLEALFEMNTRLATLNQKIGRLQSLLSNATQRIDELLYELDSRSALLRTERLMQSSCSVSGDERQNVC